ncbi:MAG: ATP-binding protein, partial [Chloroflexi bacterium]|nr:ATP-binding protein [Chloroflexota bacterium]
AAAGPPSDYPAIHSLLVAPVASPARAYGCLYLADKLGAEEFGDSDEQLAIALAAQVALAYENAARHDQLQRWNAELENVITELESFSYSVAHDLRAPLRAVIGFATAMLEDFGAQLDAEGQRYLAVIRDNAQNMGRLIDDLLAFSRLGRQSMSSGNVNIATLANTVFEELIQAEPGRKVKLKLGKPPPARGDRAMVRQVLANLLANAIKFTRGRKTAVIEVGGYEGTLENVYSVKDNGAGFDMRYADKLFGVFQRLHPTEEFEGTGIGLSIVRRVIQRHGGRVWAEGEVGRGATFYFTLPPGTKSDEQDGRD